MFLLHIIKNVMFQYVFYLYIVAFSEIPPELFFIVLLRFLNFVAFQQKKQDLIFGFLAFFKIMQFFFKRLEHVVFLKKGWGYILKMLPVLIFFRVIKQVFSCVPSGVSPSCERFSVFYVGCPSCFCFYCCLLLLIRYL